jgi:hypothetical protein
MMTAYLQVNLSLQTVLHDTLRSLARTYELRPHRLAWEKAHGEVEQKTRKRENPVRMAEWSRWM